VFFSELPALVGFPWLPSFLVLSATLLAMVFKVVHQPANEQLEKFSVEFLLFCLLLDFLFILVFVFAFPSLVCVSCDCFVCSLVFLCLFVSSASVVAHSLPSLITFPDEFDVG
jgi:hypothetical protein